MTIDAHFEIRVGIIIIAVVRANIFRANIALLPNSELSAGVERSKMVAGFCAIDESSFTKQAMRLRAARCNDAL